MKSIPLGEFEERHHGANRLIIITHEDLTEGTANTAQTIAIANVKPGTKWSVCDTELVTPFKDASDAAFNTTAITIGDGGDVDRGMASQELNENGTEVRYKSNPNTLPYTYLVADTIDLIVGSMAAKALADIDVGELRIYLKLSNIPEIARAGV